MPRTLELRAAAGRLGELVARACPEPGAAEARPGVVVALSGGPDSVALLLVARDWAARTGSPLVAAHLRHGLRPGDGDRDAEFCVELCARLGIACVVASADPRALARERGLGLEEAARHLRRHFLADTLAAQPWPGCVATGHHRDDQAETVLMRLLRGTGPEGLRGILPVAGVFIHPLLEWPRASLIAFLERQGQPWRVDATNIEGDNLRARLRREVIPLLQDVFGDGCLDGPARLAGLLEADQAWLAESARNALAAAARGEGLSVPDLLDLPPALAGRVLRGWLDLPDLLEAVHVEAILAWLREGTSGGGLDLPGGCRVVREFDRLLPGTGAGAQIDAAGDWRPEVRRLAAGEAPDEPGVGDRSDPATWRLTCPADALRGNLRVRGWRRGDRLRPLGLGGGKKVSDLLREARVPVSGRGDVLLVVDDDGILWVVGVARDERTRLLPGSTGMVTISVIRRNYTGDYPSTRGTRTP